jgi:hypothetical protein
MSSSPQREPSPVSGRYEPRCLCQACWANVRHWMQLPGEDRRAFLRWRSAWDVALLLEGRCPL